MLKKDITYTNVDGEVTTGTFYFNMTKAELLKLELSEDDGMKAKIERISKPGAKGREILETFDSILRHSYGIRTASGDFIKPPEAFQQFLASEAYSELLFEIATNADKATEFVTALMPANLAAEVEKEILQVRNEGRAMAGIRPVQDIKPYEVSVHSEPNPLNMTDNELLSTLGVSDLETAGFSDAQIMAMLPSELKTKPREVLLRAYQLKNQK